MIANKKQIKLIFIAFFCTIQYWSTKTNELVDRDGAVKIAFLSLIPPIASTAYCLYKSAGHFNNCSKDELEKQLPAYKDKIKSYEQKISSYEEEVQKAQALLEKEEEKNEERNETNIYYLNNKIKNINSNIAKEKGRKRYYQAQIDRYDELEKIANPADSYKYYIAATTGIISGFFTALFFAAIPPMPK